MVAVAMVAVVLVAVAKAVTREGAGRAVVVRAVDGTQWPRFCRTARGQD